MKKIPYEPLPQIDVVLIKIGIIKAYRKIKQKPPSKEVIDEIFEEIEKERVKYPWFKNTIQDFIGK